MPFDRETASYGPLRRILQSDKVRRLHQRFTLAPLPSKDNTTSPLVTPRGTTTRLPSVVLGIDGGYFRAEVKNGYPGAEIGYITVAAVLILLDKLHLLAKADIIDPQKHRQTQKRSSFDTALPGRGVIIDGEPTATASMRRILFEEMKECKVFADSETLLDTYEALMDMTKGSGTDRCPSCNRQSYVRRTREYRCDACDAPLFSTDAMRLHELLSPHEPCDKMYGHVMNTYEKLWLIHILRAFERRGSEWLALLGNLAFVLDGPLGVFGTPAWLSTPIRSEVARINQKQADVTGTDMMILGIEKSGAFVRHFEMLDDSETTFINPGQVLCLDNAYIRRHIVPSDGDREYGRNTYFGRKALYKSESGHRLVVNVAYYSRDQGDLMTARVEQYPRLYDVLSLLDALSSNLYPNSISPLIAAHSEAAIPLNLGKQILEDIAKTAINA